jgi:hypothetical protein
MSSALDDGTGVTEARVSRVASTGLMVAIVLVLFPQAGSAASSRYTGSGSNDSSGGLDARGVSPPSEYCSWTVISPFKRVDGWIVAKGSTHCEPGKFPHRKLRVRLQQKVEGKCVTQSTEVGVATNEEEFQLVKTQWPCEVGRWRSRMAVWFRWSEADPWLAAARRFTSPRRDVRSCPLP